MCLYHLGTTSCLRLLLTRKTQFWAGGLFEHLRQHRKRLAEEAGLGTIFIFPIQCLIDLANLRPNYIR